MGDFQEIIQKDKYEQNLSMDQSMNQSIQMEERQSMNDLLKWQPKKEEVQNPFLKDLEYMPPKLEIASVVKAPRQENRIDAPGVVTSIYEVRSDFKRIEATDDVYMKEVRRRFRMFKEAGYLSYGQATVENRDLLNELISACRWYNALHWKCWGEAGRKLKEVKKIRDLAIKERDRMNKEMERSDKAIEDRVVKDFYSYQKAYRENEKKERDELIMRDPDDVEKERFKTYTGLDANGVSRRWATFKAYTFGFVGRNILNLGMGALAGAAWLATWPVSALYGLASGKKRYYKGFNIKIPRPMSPNGWYNHYMFGQRHVYGAGVRARIDGHGIPYLAGYMALKTLQYNLCRRL